MTPSKEKDLLRKHYKEMVIFTYSTIHLLKKDKIRFYYALKGRDGKSGVVKKYKIDHLGRTVLLVPIKFSQDVHDFLTFWKCAFQEKSVLIERGMGKK